jgi:hypothetical protein
MNAALVMAEPRSGRCKHTRGLIRDGLYISQKLFWITGVEKSMQIISYGIVPFWTGDVLSRFQRGTTY